MYSMSQDPLSQQYIATGGGDAFGAQEKTAAAWRLLGCWEGAAAWVITAQLALEVLACQQPCAPDLVNSCDVADHVSGMCMCQGDACPAVSFTHGLCCIGGAS